MSLIVSLETSAKVCSVAIHDGEKLLATSEIHIEQSHASKLAVLIEEVKNKAGIEFNQLSAVAISSGPGSYTGLRIGTSTAKGLCFSLNIPLISIGSLELLAFQMKDQNPLQAYLCPMIDARRMEVYCLITDSKLNVIHPTEAKVIDEHSFQEYLDNKAVLFFGDGSDKCKEKLAHKNAHFVSGIYPKASQLGLIAHNKFQKKEFEDLITFEPHYLKEFMIKQPKDLSQ
ncbi:MAG TPA: tRNA (adenosine(37)-N6)-threonylcarbamoyltransferase complex dimerization subunit type 1 TsaB [Cyclobacteriaceae bacterium]|nr:tRNA (adenosine(37)-N6)-threonylcarbamoyltransferase complex dimerization subunit type 1 TsaB [Cyclobacteriaceae bacterium]